MFRLPLAVKANPDNLTKLLEEAGMHVVSIEPDGAIVAFRDDQNLAGFHAAIKRYEAGPRVGVHPKTGKPYKSTPFDVFEYIEAPEMRLWSRSDRIGAALRKAASKLEIGHWGFPTRLLRAS